MNNYMNKYIDEFETDLSGNGVYSIRNVRNNELYIGRSANIEYRVRQHYSNLKHGRHDSRKLLQDFSNGDTFETSVLWENKLKLEPAKLSVIEAYYMYKLSSVQSGYNKGYGYKSADIAMKVLFKHRDFIYSCVPKRDIIELPNINDAIIDSCVNVFMGHKTKERLKKAADLRKITMSRYVLQLIEKDLVNL